MDLASSSDNATTAAAAAETTAAADTTTASSGKYLDVLVNGTNTALYTKEFKLVL